MALRDRSDFKQEDILQAVVVADSFNVRFDPLTTDRPRVLLPLVNIPLLEYTLCWLRGQRVDEAIVFCCAHANQIKKYLAESEWNRPCPMKVKTVVSDSCFSVGDALRDLYNKSIILSDFVLVHGDLVSNIKLKPIVDEHKKRRQLSKGVVMTMVCRRAPPDNKTRCKEDDLVLAVRPSNQHIVAFQRTKMSKRFTLPVEVLENAASIHYDLLDCGVSVCSSHMLQLLTDNFDYQTRDDFIRGVLGSEDILGNSIHLHVETSDYAARASNLYMYQAVTRDVLLRRPYPYLPDLSAIERVGGRLNYDGMGVYRHNNVKIAPDSRLKQTAVDSGSSIGSNSVISNSTIGKNCMIGSNVEITNGYIWDNVIIGNNVEIREAIIDENVRIGAGSRIEAGCILGHGVVIDCGVVVAKGTRLVSDPSKGKGPLMNNTAGTAYLYQTTAGIEDDELNNLDCAAWSKDDNVESDDDDEFDDLESESGDEVDIDQVSDKKIFEELISNLDRALDENVAAENAILEINSIKHAYGVQIHTLTSMLVRALLELPFRKLSGTAGTNIARRYKEKCKELLTRFRALLHNYIKNPESEKTVLVAMDEFASQSPEVISVLPDVAHFLYDEDVLSEDVIIKWWNIKDRPFGDAFHKVMTKLVDWLNEADEESD